MMIEFTLNLQEIKGYPNTINMEPAGNKRVSKHHSHLQPAPVHYVYVKTVLCYDVSSSKYLCDGLPISVLGAYIVPSVS